MFNNFFSICFILIATSLIQQVRAESQDNLFSMSIEQLMSLKVTTASKRPQLANKAPSIISVFTQADIKKMGVVSLIDIIKHSPAIETSMGPDGQWRVSIRGARKDGIILFLIDGHPFNDFYDGQAQFDLPIDLVAKVEIIRGPGSALYGTNAVAGVINVFTVKSGSSANIAMGTNATKRASANYTHQLAHGKLSYNIGLNSSNGANQIEGEDFVQVINFNQSNLETNRYIDEYYLSTSFKNDDFEIQFFGLDRERGPWVGPSVSFGPKTQVSKSQFFIKGIYQYQLTDKLLMKPKIHLDQTDFKSFNQDILAGTIVLNNLFENDGFTLEKYRTATIGGELQFEYSQSKDSHFLGGVSFDNLEMTDYDLRRNYEVIGFIPHDVIANHDQLVFQQADQDRQISALYAQSEFSLADFSLTFGFRYDDYSDFGSSFNPRFGAVYNINSEWVTKFLYGSAFRAPTFKELYDNTRIGPQGFSGNNALQPEENETLELGVEYQNTGYVLRGNIFDIKSTNLIGLFDPDGSGSRGSIQNLGEIKTRGFETEFIYQLNNSTRFVVNYSRYKSIFNWSKADAFTESQNYLINRGNKQLFNQPRSRANIGVDLSNEKWQLFFSVNYGGRASHNNTLALEGLRNLIVDEYIQYNFSLDYQLSSALNLRLLANDLGSNKNSDPNGSSESDSLGIEGLLQPGKTIMLELAYQF